MLQKQYGFIVLMQILFLVLKPFTINYGTNFKIYKTFKFMLCWLKHSSTNYY